MGPVVILGCGPAGLSAAKAVTDSGREAIIISSRLEPSKQYGCQYLHAPVPGYDDVPQVRVNYALNGTPEQYRKKVYGSAWEGRVSPEDFIGEHQAWDIRETYRRLWRDLIEGRSHARLLFGKVQNGRIPFVADIKPSLIISTIPAQALCHELHTFNGHTIYANGSTSSGLANKDSILCDGTPERFWYRISNVFGYVTTEWTLPPADWHRAVPVVKPLSTDCACCPDVLRVGRYGTWTKSVLVHEVYPAVIAALEPSPELVRGIERVTGETYLGRGKWRM